MLTGIALSSRNGREKSNLITRLHRGICPDHFLIHSSAQIFGGDQRSPGTATCGKKFA
jgi:hypothetical protein